MTPATGPPRWRTARQRRGLHAPPFETIQCPRISITISRATCALIEGLMARRTTVTINDVANEAGVALGTVSNAFNHPEKSSPRDPQAHQRGLRETRLRPQPERAHACGWAKPVVWPGASQPGARHLAPNCQRRQRRGAKTRVRPAHRQRGQRRHPLRALPHLFYGHADGGHSRAAHERLWMEALFGDALGPHGVSRLPQQRARLFCRR